MKVFWYSRSTQKYPGPLFEIDCVAFYVNLKYFYIRIWIKSYFMKKIWNNTNKKKFKKSHTFRINRPSEMNPLLNQAGEDDAIIRFPKPEYQMTVGCLAKSLATFQRLWRSHSQTRLAIPYWRTRWHNALLRNYISCGNKGRKTQSTFNPCCKRFATKPDQLSTSIKAIER